MENNEKKPESGIVIPQPPPPQDKPVDRDCTEVSFRGNRRMYYMVAKGAHINVGDLVIADTEKGHDIGKVTLKGTLAELKKGRVTGHNIIRKANAQDREKIERLHREEREAFIVGKERITRSRLEMSLVEVEKQFDESKMTFFFLAEQRVDFRDLVKELATTFHTRIELRQIGVRDEAKRVDGIGVCGRHLCCSAYLESFEQISTQMARAQHLSLNQSKLSGNCGRLKCCLKYELAFYEEMNHCLPQPGTKLKTPKGDATVAGVNIMKNTIKIIYEETRNEDFLSPEECAAILNGTKIAPPAPAPAPAPEPTLELAPKAPTE